MCNYLFTILTLIFSTQALYAQNIERLIKKSGINSGDLGISVVREGQAVFEHNAEKDLIPASLSKILTAIAVFKTYKPDERLITELQSDAKIEGEYLSGPLYLKGGGDPSFLSENMWVLVNNFRRTGVKKIKGPIYIDDYLFDSEYFDKSRQSLRVDRAYDSPVSASSFNWNSVNVYIRPTQKGELAIVYPDPRSSYFVVKNDVKTVSGSSNNITIQLREKEMGEELVVSGTIGVNSNEAVKYAGIQNPYLWVGKNLIQFLSDQGIAVENTQVLKTKSSVRFTKLAEAKGWSIFELVDGMMKYSNNFIAEMLTKLIAVRKGEKIGSINAGVQHIKKIIEDLGLSQKKYSFENPSGFSNKNKISAKNLSFILDKSVRDFTISSYLLSTLAVPTGEGTLSKRMSGAKSPYLVRGKTGLLSGAAGLAGYFANSKGEVFSYAFIYNGGGEEANARELFDKIILEMAN